MTTIELLEYIASERQALAHCYPLPSPLDCVRYALTELGEYEDAMLRAERTGDKRNNVKPSDARRELGQVGEMIGAAIVQLDGWKMLVFDCWNSGRRITLVADLSISIAEAMYSSYPDCIVPGEAADAFGAWIDLCHYHGWEPHALLAERYAQVRERHCREAA